jgi:hypothetical protein
VGTSTRRASRSAVAQRFQIPLKLVAASNEASGNGSANMSPTRNSPSGVRARAMSTSTSEASSPATARDFHQPHAGAHAQAVEDHIIGPSGVWLEQIRPVGGAGPHARPESFQSLLRSGAAAGMLASSLDGRSSVQTASATDAEMHHHR